jgi:ketosteroid isomerase-like protein
MAEKVEQIRSWLDAFNRGEFGAMLDVLDPEVELHEWPMAPGAETYHGRDGALMALEKWFEVWEWMHVEIEDVVELGDRVLLRFHQRAKGKGSEIEVEIRSFSVYTFSGSQIKRIQLFTERDPALEAAGLAPESEVRI